jgi:hypothetical protein
MPKDKPKSKQCLYSMSIELFKAECPGVFLSLTRLLEPSAVASISTDYGRAVRFGGNEEPQVIREEGVSFNPRLGRILMILLRDAGVRDPLLFRAAVYASADIPEGEWPELPEEARAIIQAIRDGNLSDERALAIRMVWELDSLRHLHMTTYSAQEREQVLLAKERPEYLQAVPKHLEGLAAKVQHAVHLQRKRLARDTGTQGE